MGSDLSLESIAEDVYVSRFHLCRAFTVSTGNSIYGYVRARRLSEAAKHLRGAPDILAVALEAGYGSHEAFTRAFRQHFGLTPEQVRAQPCLQLNLQEPLRMDELTITPLAPPRLAKSEALLIFGLSETYRQSKAGIPSQWSRLVPYLGHIPEQVGHLTYGVICNADDSGSFDYLCGVEVRSFPAHPPEFTRLRIPPQTYAVFEHRDHISSIANTIKAIWEKELGAAGYKAADGPSFERYDERFDPRTGLGGLEIWVPVKV